MPDDPMRAAFAKTYPSLFDEPRAAWNVWQTAWQAAVAWERERPAREHAAKADCPECGGKVEFPGDELCQPCMFRLSCDDRDRVPLTPAGSVEVRYAEPTPMKPQEYDEREHAMHDPTFTSDEINERFGDPTP